MGEPAGVLCWPQARVPPSSLPASHPRESQQVVARVAVLGGGIRSELHLPLSKMNHRLSEGLWREVDSQL